MRAKQFVTILGASGTGSFRAADGGGAAEQIYAAATWPATGRWNLLLRKITSAHVWFVRCCFREGRRVSHARRLGTGQLTARAQTALLITGCSIKMAMTSRRILHDQLTLGCKVDFPKIRCCIREHSDILGRIGSDRVETT